MIVIRVPRDIYLSANNRYHWRVKADKTRQLRNLAYWAARASKIGPMRRARLEVTVSWPDRRRRDDDNCRPTIKALVDGMVTDAGLLPDDDNRHLIGPDVRVAESLCDKRYACQMEFRFEPIEVAA